MASPGSGLERPPSAESRRTIPLQEITLPHRCPRPVRMYVLARAPYFRGLSTQELGRIDDRMRTHTYAPDALIYRAGERAEAMYVVDEGRVKMFKDYAGGTVTVSDMLGPEVLLGVIVR